MDRSPQALIDAITQWDVLNNPLFMKGKLLADTTEAPAPWALWNGAQYGVIPYTRCNGFAGCVLLSLGCPVPWQTANQHFAWFPSPAAQEKGWTEVDYATAVNRANAGFPLVIVAQEPGHGHIAIGRPSPATYPTKLYCAAAGAVNSPCMWLVDQFGGLAPTAKFFTHD
jgi:hypothetical protein